MAITCYEGFEHYTLDSLPVAEREHPLQMLLRDFTYKPGWTFRFFETERDIRLEIKALVIDADNPAETAIITSFNSVDKMIAERPPWKWERWLRDRIIDFEKHEVDEFFQINGVKVFDPH